MNSDSTCPICGGVFKPGTTTFTVDYGKGVFIVRHVPADVCGQCGEGWISDDISAKLEALLDNAKNSNAAVEVIDMAA